MEENEYYRCFDKFKISNAENYSYAIFDMYELYPMLYYITPLDVKINQRIDSFKTDCLFEIKRNSNLNTGDIWDSLIIKNEEVKDGYLLSCYYKKELYKHIKLLKNNKVDFTYDKAIYNHKDNENYTENLLNHYTKAFNVLQNVVSASV